MLSGAKCRSLLEDLAVIGTKHLPFLVENKKADPSPEMRDQDDMAEGGITFQVPTFRQAADSLAPPARHANAFCVFSTSVSPIPSMPCGGGNYSGEFGCGDAFCHAGRKVRDAKDHGCRWRGQATDFSRGPVGSALRVRTRIGLESGSAGRPEFEDCGGSQRHDGHRPQWEGGARGYDRRGSAPDRQRHLQQIRSRTTDDGRRCFSTQAQQGYLGGIEFSG
jgi:hypothetical protein